MDYMSVKEASSKWGIGERRICTLCNQKRVSGAVKKGIWMIPQIAEKPDTLKLGRSKRSE